ncbi:ParB N-terminal domain-containing protein [Nocardioides cheoyonin]|jgi:ParB family chromosome partitioning protein|uniref:ParB N-terminal domain-containing protein n=1 Tax=Nocardioides cheoyonin TaxID=3156615 RepID=UPI0032B5E57B
MPEQNGHIDLERKIDSITIGVRHRQDLGDLAALAASMDTLGMLQPITITPDGLLVCGRRRLEAARHLGWPTIKVWVRSGISGELTYLLAQQHENSMRKPLSPLEAESLFREIQNLQREEARLRQEATRFGAPEAEDAPGAGGPPAPRGEGDTRAQTARLITGTQSYHRFEQIGWVRSIAHDERQHPQVRELAGRALAAIERGDPVEPAYKKIRAAVELARHPTATITDPDDELAQLAAEALARVQQAKARKGLRALQNKPTGLPHYRTLRSFILTWTELEGWSKLYDVEALASSLSASEWERFERVVDESVEFAKQLRAVREEMTTSA